MGASSIAFFVLMAACSSSDSADDTSADTTSVRPVRFLALGDSYTIGESVPQAERWPLQLGEHLGADVEIVATTGWTTADLSNGIDRADPVGPYDLVSLLIGVNNQFQGRSIDEYRIEFAQLLQRAVGFAGDDVSRVIVVSIPDWGVTPFGSSYGPERVANEIDAFNAVAMEEALVVGAHWVDITPISRSGDPVLVASDGLHPSGDQYSAWVEVIRPLATEIILRGE